MKFLLLTLQNLMFTIDAASFNRKPLGSGNAFFCLQGIINLLSTGYFFVDSKEKVKSPLFVSAFRFSIGVIGNQCCHGT